MQVLHLIVLYSDTFVHLIKVNNYKITKKTLLHLKLNFVFTNNNLTKKTICLTTSLSTWHLQPAHRSICSPV